MARSRNIKPGFFHNDELAELPVIDRLCFIGLWTICDFKGCLEFRPKKIKAQILPYDEVDIEGIAINLDKSGFISIYSVQGKQYLKVLNFTKHQNPHKNERAAGSGLPDIDDSSPTAPENKGPKEKPDLIGTNPDNIATDPADSLLLIPDSGFPINPMYMSNGKESEKSPESDIDRSAMTPSLDWIPDQLLWEAIAIRSGLTGADFGPYLAEFSLHYAGHALQSESFWLGKLSSWIKRNQQKPEGINHARHQGFNKQKPTAIDRVNRAGEDYLRRKAEAASDAQAMEDPNGNLREFVCDTVRGEPVGRMGETIDGDFSRPNSDGAERPVKSG